MQWLIKWEELTTRTLLHNGVATPSFNKLTSSQKVNIQLINTFYWFCLSKPKRNTFFQDLYVQKSVSMWAFLTDGHFSRKMFYDNWYETRARIFAFYCFYLWL